MGNDCYWPVHAHSEYSVLDGIGSVRDMVLTVADYDQPALALTDHGNMAGCLHLYKECRKAGIVPFPGEEFYLVMDATPPAQKLAKGEVDIRLNRLHLGILALNAEGFRALIRLSSRSHSRDRFYRKPLIDMADLATLGRDHGEDVAITTGCYFGYMVQNVLASPPEHRIDTAIAVIGQLHSFGFKHVFVELQNHGIEHTFDHLISADVSHDADIAAILHTAAQRTGTPCVIGQDSHYCTETSEPLLMADLSYKPIGEVMVGDEVLGWHRPDGKSNKVATAATVTHVMHREAEAVKLTFESGAMVVCTPDHNWMQYGPWKAGVDRWGPLGVDSEAVRITMPRQTPEGITDRVVDRRLRAIGADRVVSIEPVGIKTVVSLTTTTGNYISAGLASKNCDAHDKASHDLMKEIAYLGGNGEDSEFPGDSFHLADSNWIKAHWLPEQWSDAMAGHQHLLDLNTLVLPELDTYKFHAPSVGPDPDADLVDAVYDAFAKHDKWGDQEYSDRIDSELDVIRRKEMAGYFLLVADYMQWCRDEGIFVNARGSANGSLVCYLLGITNVDPIVWGTGFDRFLSMDRAKPPDIDVDVESDRRDDVICYIRSRYPSLTQLGTWLRLGVSSTEMTRGSVFVQWHAAQRSRGNPQKKIPPSVEAQLRHLSKLDVRKSPGAHAAGFVLPGDGLAVDDYLATMLIPSSGLTVTQAPMGDVEDAGYVKLDLLGLQSLTTMRRVMEMIGKDPIADGMEWIPNDDPDACRMLRSGVAENGIFQFEGFSTAKGAKQMGVRSTHDAIVALALFRPAMMSSGMTDRYLAARKTKTPETIHPTVDDLFTTTWGVPVFQEDVLALMERAGLDADDRNEVLKAVKASNDKVAEYALAIFQRIGKVFVARATAVLGVSPDDARKMWRTVMDFSDYGFNRAHATAYGLMGYRMAYLKAHYPLEFHAALLETWAGTDKEAKYIREARRMGLLVRKPDVNLSGVSWSIDRDDDVLVKGLLTIKGIGKTAATAIIEEREHNGRYLSLDDFCQRASRPVTGAKPLLKNGEWKGTLLTLRDNSALRSLGVAADV